MIFINKSGFIRYKNLKFKCTLGGAGVGEKKIEGSLKVHLCDAGRWKGCRVAWAVAQHGAYNVG